ncbi:MAG TPA: methionyl-tRNA formyltransferase [Patescibacteria group bacterium]|nr:methionyl-tRNA formyltransferase [Patescibacteria group bacterium]
MKVVFFGTPEFVTPVLQTLEKNFEVLKAFRNPKELTNEEIEKLKNIEPDIFVVASFGKIFSKEFLEIPKFGSINIHPSLLPKYRGTTPVQTAILNGDKTTGVTIIKMDGKIDHGPILAQKEVEIFPNETAPELLQRLFIISAEMLPDALSNYIKESSSVSEQEHEKATFTRILKKESGRIDADNPPTKERLNNMINAFYPWPGVWTIFKGKVVKFLPGDKIQVEGKKSMTYKDFVNGYKEGKELLEKLNLRPTN